MKFLAVILSFYFLALNVLPCSDNGAINDSENTEVHVDFDHGQDHDDCELCSPFCQCHCCHSHTVDFGISEFQPFDEAMHHGLFTYREGLGTNFSPSLLQPPKIIV